MSKNSLDEHISIDMSDYQEKKGITAVNEVSNEWYRISSKEVARRLQVDIKDGLTSGEAEHRLNKYGANSLGDENKISYGKIIAHQIFNAMILVLFISMVIAFAIKDWISAGVLAFVVVLNIGVGFIQEVKAENTVGSLRSLSSPTARVLRDGNSITVPADQIVIGDIVHIKVGDTIPADLRLISTMNLESDEALLTGESIPVMKDGEIVFDDLSKNVPVGDRVNIAYSSAIVSKGRGTGIVVATGIETEIGKIASSLRSDSGVIQRVDKSNNRTPKKREYVQSGLITTKNVILNVLGINVGTPLQQKLAILAIILFWIAVVFAIVVMASQKMIVNKEVAIYAICVALSMIPSALIVVLTITMAVGTKVMVQRHVIVRKLDSLEALGGVNDICSDKTGTLTQGKMVAKKVWIPNLGTYSVDNITDPFDPTVGSLSFCKYSPRYISQEDIEVNYYPYSKAEEKNLSRFLVTATLANIATINQHENPETGHLEWKAHGDATEIAIKVFTKRLEYSKSKLTDSYIHLAEFPFDSSIKRMSVVYKDPEDKILVHTKGAVERILKICKYWNPVSKETDSDYNLHFDSQENKEMSDQDRELIESNMNALSSQGLRVLAFASKEIRGEIDLDNRENVENELVFHGLVGIYDPPRTETAGSVKMCHQAGINVHMLTGDHPGTAQAIAQEVGIIPRNLYHYSKDVVSAMCMTADQFDSLSDEQIDNLPVLPLVIARCAPQTKVRMIDALHRRNKFVAMTGDGVNDSPSLKKSDVGIAMGMNGSDVAKDASDLVLTDDNFASILNAIEEGRRMSMNIQKFVLQLLAENVAQAIYLMVGLSFIDKSGFSVFPLSPVEVLWILVITSCFPAMGLGQEKAQEDILNLPPNRTIFTWEVIIDMVVYGFWMAASCLSCFVLVIYGVGDGNLGFECNKSSSSCKLVFQGRSTAFACMTWCALILSWECIHSSNSLLYMRQNTDNPWWKQTAIDLYDNQFLFWSVVLGFVTVFPVVYIPVINDQVFLHGPISWEWGLAVAFTVFFFGSCETWKAIKRLYRRRQNRKAKNPEYDLERSDPFKRYASFSRSNTVDTGTLPFD